MRDWPSDMGEPPAFSAEYYASFITPQDARATFLRTIEQMEDAIYALFRYRADAFLQPEVMVRRRLGIAWIDPEEYSMCSDNT